MLSAALPFAFAAVVSVTTAAPSIGAAASSSTTAAPSGVPRDSASFRDPANAPASPCEEEIVAELHETHRIERARGLLATRRATSSSVRALGATIARRHLMLGRALLALARIRHLDPEQSARASYFALARAADDEATTSALYRLHGPAFDRAFLQAVLASRIATLARIGEVTDESLPAEVRRFLARLSLLLVREKTEAARLLQARRSRS